MHTSKSPTMTVLAPWASLRLTVALLAMATFLVFAGTVAQIDKGIWTVVDEYFRCAFTWIDFQIFFPRKWDIPGGFWFPGGWLIGGLLFTNLLAAHIVRFKVGAKGNRLLLGLAVILAGAVFTGLVIGGAFDEKVAATEDDAFWRVLLRLGKGGGAALILMAGCQMVFKKRGGIVLIHSGVLLLLVNEFITGTHAVEGRMEIKEGQSSNYVEHTRDIEMVFVDHSDPQADKVTVIPRQRLIRGGTISNESLPLDVTVVRYMSNSSAFQRESAPAMPNPATAGSGLHILCVDQDEVAGTSMSQSADVPAAYVQLRDRASGQTIGTYLISPWLEDTIFERQVVQVGGREWDIALRFPRTYKPYSIELIDFRHDRYVGTDTPKNFSSEVRVVDETANVDRTVKIWMNNPLRYAGETFYQTSFKGDNITVLQVVRNDGWMIPYISCMFVGVGLTAHMGASLLTFLRRRIAA